VSSGEAGIGMEGQIMSSKCTKIFGGWGFPMGSLQFSPDPLARFKGPTSKAPTSKRRKGKGRRREGRGAKMIYAPGRQKPSHHHCYGFIRCTYLTDAILIARLHFEVCMSHHAAKPRH